MGHPRRDHLRDRPGAGVIVRAQRDEPLDALIWRALGRLDAQLLDEVLDDPRNGARVARPLLPGGTEVYLPEPRAEEAPAVPVLQCEAELWS